MSRALVASALILCSLFACDPETPDAPGVVAPDVVVQYVTAPCGSIPPTPTEASTDLDAPAVFEVGQIVGGRIDPDAATNFRHFWDVALDEGVYHMVVDNDVPDGTSTNTGIQIVQLDGAGVELDTLVRGNEIDHRARLHEVVVADRRTTLRLEVSSVFGIEDYALGVFEMSTAVPSPFFEQCPVTTPLERGVPLDLTLAAEDLDDRDEVWLTFDADVGDYAFTVDAEQLSGESTNLQYRMEVVDRFGQRSRVEEILRANAIDVTTRLVGDLTVGEPSSYWLRLINDNDGLSVTITLD
ncbi:MAG: hypothetical protein AAF602_03645 [Myxococcota bacterium]